MSWQDRFGTREEFLAEVKRLVLEVGLSYRLAALAIGPGISKNVVVRAMQTILGRSRSTVKFPDSVWPSATKTPEDKKPENERQAPVHLLSVVHGQCRAPLWPDFLRSREKVDPSGHMYCGKPCREGMSWCDEHHAVFILPPEAKKVKPKKMRSDNSAHFR